VSSANGSTNRRARLVALAIAALAVLVSLLVWWSRPPQMGPDEQVANVVDALFTAITARDEKLLADCERRLLALKDAGKLPLEPSAYLDNIIGKARAGRWESAAQSLYDFIRAQQRQDDDKHPRMGKNPSNSGRI
jgi:hypothetical protein